MTIRTLVVDDQPGDCDRLLSLLAVEPDFTVAGVAGGRSAVAEIRQSAPDLVFFNPQTAETNGFGLVDAVGPASMPPIVVVANGHQYAASAFEVEALDYLVKPLARPRLRLTLDRVRRHFERERARDTVAKLVALATELREPPPARERLLVRSGGRMRLVETAHIDWAEAVGKYVRLHTQGQKHLTRETITALHARLGGDRFFRIHRSRLVNLSRVSELRLNGGGAYEVVLHDGQRLRLSRNYRDALQTRLASLP